MDPALAALVGAIIGAAVAGVVPYLTARNQRIEQLRANQRVAVAELDEALIEHIRGRFSGRGNAETRTVVVFAAHRLAMVAPAKDHELDKMVQYALEHIDSTPNRLVGLCAVNAVSTVLIKWYRREVSGRGIGDAYLLELDHELGKYSREG
ncbi:hypothetical protein ACEYYH_02075 [Microbacterium trichothecenolyticum]|uniref:hypothetical protein n=1 Tax=Microbacterium trichothecenolyticum TaxID=69370 RepID=UPI0035BE8FAB